MNKKLSKLSIFTLIITLSCACTLVAKKAEVSNKHLAYEQLQQVKLPSGNSIMRWHSKALLEREIKAVYVEPMVMAPAPEDAQRVSQAFVVQTLQYLDKQFKNSISQSYQLTSKANADIRVGLRITSVRSKYERFKVRELIPLKAVLASVFYIAGERDRDVYVISELTVHDNKTGELLALSVRKGRGVQLSDNTEALSFEKVEPLLSEWFADISEQVGALAE